MPRYLRLPRDPLLSFEVSLGGDVFSVEFLFNHVTSPEKMFYVGYRVFNQREA